MSEFKSMTKENLKTLVADTEATLNEIKTEIARREEAEQESELEYLDVHFKNAELSLQTIRNFFAYLREELRKP